VAKRSGKSRSTLAPQSGERVAEGRVRGLTVAAATIVVTILVVYARSLTYPFTNFDDFDYIVDNRHINTGLTLANIRWALTAMYASNWHPLTWISHQLDVSLFGVDAGKLRIVSILLHAASTVLLLVFLVRTTGRKWASAAAAALFALHPLRVESIVWVSERKDTLSTFLFLATLLAYAGYLRKRSATRYLLTFVLFVLGLSAKPMLITLPFVLLLLDYWPLKRELTPRLILEKLPFFALTIPSAIITMHAQKEAIHPIAIGVRIANAVVAYVAYLGKIAIPTSLAVMYPFRDQIGGAEAVVSAIVLIAITVIVIRFAKRFPYLLIGWLWYLGTLVPVIGIVQVGGQAMADRYTYIPSIGVTVAIVWLIADLLHGRATLEIGIATAILAAVLAVLTYVQVGTWHDTLTLFEHAVAVTPQNPQSLNALGREYLFRNQYDLAQEQFKAAIAVDSHYDDAHDALGSTLSELGDAEGAEREFRAAIALNPRPVYFRDLGQLLATTGRIDEALSMYQKATGAQRDPEALAEIAAIKGDADNAIRYYREAIEERPRAPDLHNNLAAMLAHKGLEDQAMVEYQTAVSIAPKQFDAHMNLGAILTRHKRNDEALREFRAAAEIRPNSPEPHVYLALLYAQTNHTADAIAELRAAGEIDEAAANEELTTALGLQPKPTNLRDYIAMLSKSM
jgi:tetratricopeptide (TPR) repeat protein